MATVPMPRPTLDRAIWGTCSPCPMPTLDPYNYPIVAATPHDWYNPAVFVSGCENPANAGSSGTGGGSFLYDPKEDAWMDIPHFLGMDPDYSVAGTYSHGAATFHPTGPSGTAVSGSASGIVVDKYLPGDVAVGATIRITGGTGSGQSRTITATSGATRSAGYLPTYRSGSIASGWVGTGSVSLPTPTGVQQGDLMVMEFFSNQIPPSQVTSDPAWTLGYTTWAPGANFYVTSVFYKVAGASEPANYTWDVGTWWHHYTTWAVVSASFVSAITRYASTTSLDTYVWSSNVPMAGHRLCATVLTQSRNGFAANSVSGLTTPSATGVSANSLWDLSPNGGQSSPYQVSPSIAFQNASDSQCGWTMILAQANGSYTESTTLTVDSAWSVQPDNTSTYAIDSGSFWCWRGNASDSTWAWSKYDIARGVWEKKTSTDSVSAPTYINSTVGVDSTFGPNTTFSVPSGTADGDLMVLAITTGQGGATAPAGWTLLGYANSGGGSCSTMYVYYRVASSEPASYTFTRDGTAAGCLTTCATYRNASTPLLMTYNGDNHSRQNVTASMVNIHQLPAVVASFAQCRGDTGVYPYQLQPSSTSDTYRNGSAFSRFGDQVVSRAAAANSSSVVWTWLDDTFASPTRYSLMAWALVLVPGTSPGMSNYGKADPTYQGGIHAVTDSSDYIYLGGDAQTSLRRYSISGNSWSALTAHEPYTRPLRNVGGGMAYQTVSGDPYIFYWTPNESENAYDNTARFYAYDLTSNLWYDLLVSPGSPVSAMPSKYKRILSYNGRILWLSDRSEVVVQDPTKIDALTPDNYLALVRNSPSRSGGTPFMVTDSITGSKFLYHIEHTNVQGIQPLRCNVTGRDWV